MNKIAIITIFDENNYGNRLQNYAVQKVLEKSGCEVQTLKNYPSFNNNFFSIGRLFLKQVHNLLLKFKMDTTTKNRYRNFHEFTQLYIHTGKVITKKNANKFVSKYDYFITGSDQVWNPNFGRLSDIDLLTFVPYKKSISLSASFGVSEIDDKYSLKVKNALENMKSISVREDAGKEIVMSLTKRNDVEVLIDPTMLLDASEWDQVSKRPSMLENEKYIFNYFLGCLSNERQEEIQRIAIENQCKVINILDPNDSFYVCGPSEFIYLEKHAFLICTDSFHSSVFALLYNRPFIIFNREEKGLVSMNSRIDTLINKFHLNNRYYNENGITNENMNHDYKDAYNILKIEREKSYRFITESLASEKEL